MEIAVGGKDASEKIEYAKISFRQTAFNERCIKAGDFVDIIAITKVKDGKELLKDSVLLNKEEKQPEK